MGGALVNLYQSKAVDRVDHRYLAVVLWAVGLDPTFRSWINTLYSGIMSVVQVKGFFLRLIVTEPSAPQDCTLSQLMYMVTIELLLQRLETWWRWWW